MSTTLLNQRTVEGNSASVFPKSCVLDGVIETANKTVGPHCVERSQNETCTNKDITRVNLAWVQFSSLEAFKQLVKIFPQQENLDLCLVGFGVDLDYHNERSDNTTMVDTMSKVLTHNKTTVTHLDMFEIWIDDEGCGALVKALKQNTMLQHLSLLCSDVTADDAFKAIANALEHHNNSLTHPHLANPGTKNTHLHLNSM